MTKVRNMSVILEGIINIILVMYYHSSGPTITSGFKIDGPWSQIGWPIIKTGWVKCVDLEDNL